jgi:hypothetical protein
LTPDSIYHGVQNTIWHRVRTGFFFSLKLRNLSGSNFRKLEHILTVLSSLRQRSSTVYYLRIAPLWSSSHGGWIYKAYHHLRCEFKSWCVLDTTLCDKVCQWLAAGQWLIFSTNKTDRHDIISQPRHTLTFYDYENI